MKNLFKKTVVLFLACLLVFSAVACSKPSESGGREPTHDIDVTETDVPFIRNMSSRYKLIVPENAQENEEIAAEEIQYFMREATGYRLSVVTDAAADDSDYFVSIGDTQQFRDSGLTADDNLLQRSGFRIVTEGNSVYIFCGQDYASEGCIYGAYEFLKQMIGYQYYSDLEVKYDKTDEVYLKDFEVTDIPDFDNRYLNSYTVQSNQRYMYRMRMTSRNNHSTVVRGHTHFKILDPDVYYADHHDWYNSQVTQLCLSNEEMRQEFVEQLKGYIEREPNADLFYLCLEDVAEGCDCKDCQENMKKYGTYAGINNVFMNKVSDDIAAWLDEEYPGRKVNFRTYAYYATQEPPVKYDAATDTYTPYHPDVVLRDNIQVQLADLSMNRSHAIDDPVNAKNFNELRGWGALTDNLAVYLYSVNFRDYLFCINDFNVIAQSYPVYYQYGVTEMYDSSSYEFTNRTGFDDLRAYLKTQLWWDTSLSYDELVEDFMVNYYQEAQDPMREYYNFYRAWVSARQDAAFGWQDGYKITSANFPKSVVDKLDSLLQEALDAAEPVKNTDPERYERLVAKIEKERVMPMYMYLSLYQPYFTKSALAEMIDWFDAACSRYNILLWMEAQRIQPIIDGWRTNL